MLGIFKIGSLELLNSLPRLALNRDPPDLCCLSSLDYRCKLPAHPAPGRDLSELLTGVTGSDNVSEGPTPIILA
jgi:hypothetical protein